MPIEIDAGCKLSLPDAGPGNRKRFAALFQSAWGQIPDEAREVICRWWGKGIVTQATSLVIDFLLGYHLAGECREFGHTIYFNADVADAMPDDILPNLIGHELAHVWHYTNPESDTNKAPGNVKAKEDEADALADSWGFRMEDLRDWANENSGTIVARTGNPNVGW